MLMGRVGQQLPALLCGETDALKLLNELKHSPVAEMRYHDDPVYLGMRLALEEIFRNLAGSWPVSRRLRILEITAGSSELPKILTGSLPEDRFDYVLALPDEAMQARQQIEYQEDASIVVARYEPATLKLSADRRLPDAFDVIVLHHALHRTNSPHTALAQIRHLLAAGGILCWLNSIQTGVPIFWKGSIPAGGVSATKRQIYQYLHCYRPQRGNNC